MTPKKAQALLDAVDKNPPRICMAWCGKAKDECACYLHSVALEALNDAAPDLSRAYIEASTESAKFCEINIVSAAMLDTMGAELTRLQAKVAAADGLWQALDDSSFSDLESGDYRRVFAAFTAYEEAGK